MVSSCGALRIGSCSAVGVSSIGCDGEIGTEEGIVGGKRKSMNGFFV